MMEKTMPLLPVTSSDESLTFIAMFLSRRHPDSRCFWRQQARIENIFSINVTKHLLPRLTFMERLPDVLLFDLRSSCVLGILGRQTLRVRSLQDFLCRASSFIKMMKLAWAMLLFATTISCASGRMPGGPPTTELPWQRSQATPSVFESFAPGTLQIIAAPAGDDSSVVEPGDDTSTATASPASDQLVIPESYDRRQLLVAQRNCSCACALSCDNEPPTFNMSTCAEPAASLQVDAVASPTAGKKGACGGEAPKSAIDGAFSGIAANLLACYSSCKSLKVSWWCSANDPLKKRRFIFCAVFMTGLSSALGVASGCSRAAIKG